MSVSGIGNAGAYAASASAFQNVRNDSEANKELPTNPANSPGAGLGTASSTQIRNTEQSSNSNASSDNGDSEESAGVRGRSSESEESSDPSELTPEEEAQVRELKARDREVRAHEAAHLAAAGSYATGGISYTYQTGPDGVNYAVGGEVGIDTSPENTPEETLSKAQTIRTAALAPAEPSPQDYRVAAQANQLATQARAEISQQQQEARRDQVLQQANQAYAENGAIVPQVNNSST